MSLSHPHSKTKFRFGCICGWRGYRIRRYAQQTCPKCQRVIVELIYNQVADNYIFVPTCASCKHWQRNEGFPNRLGKCLRGKSDNHPLENQETHECFGCADWRYNAAN